MDVDPSSADTAQTKSKLYTLMKAAQLVIDAILVAESDFPRPLRRLCVLLRREVAERYPDRWLSCVSVFVFLRYFLPALVSPERDTAAAAVQDHPGHRAALLIGKLIQTLANGSWRVASATAADPMKAFMLANSRRMEAYLDRLSSSDGGAASASAPSPRIDTMDRSDASVMLALPPAMAEESLARIHHHLVSYYRRIATHLDQHTVTETFQWSASDEVLGLLHTFSALPLETMPGSPRVCAHFEQILLGDNMLILKAMLRAAASTPAAYADFAIGCLGLILPLGTAYDLVAEQLTEEIEQHGACFPVRRACGRARLFDHPGDRRYRDRLRARAA